MNYTELKEIVRHIKKMVPCSNCNRKFNNDTIHVLSSYNHEALFHFNCSHCHNQLIVHVTVSDTGDDKSKLSIHAKNTHSISQNDVLDMHNFLNGFKGDFRKLFSPENH